MGAPKVVLITGCSSGFGRGMVDEFLARGWHVLATIRGAAARQDLLAGPRARHPDRLQVLDFDVTDPGQREAVIAAARALGRLDCLVNNAGYGTFGALEDLSEAQLRQQFETNFFGAALLTRACLPLIRVAKGSVLFVTSIFGINGFPLTGAYCSSKFALEGLAESLHYELAPHGVRVGLIEPGANVTGFGERVVWLLGEAYQDQTAGYRSIKARIGATGKDHTPYIARLAADMAEGRTWGLRKVVGLDAWAGYLFRRLLPAWISVPLSRMMYGKLFRRPAP